MLKAINRKAAYWLLAALATLLLLGAPTIIPAAYADCSGAGSTTCPG
jgi:hypothetical protein